MKVQQIIVEILFIVDSNRTWTEEMSKHPTKSKYKLHAVSKSYQAAYTWAWGHLWLRRGGLRWPRQRQRPPLVEAAHAADCVLIARFLDGISLGPPAHLKGGLGWNAKNLTRWKQFLIFLFMIPSVGTKMSWMGNDMTVDNSCSAIQNLKS